MDEMAGVTGLEPATSGVTGRHSNQLSYTPAKGPGAQGGPGRLGIEEPPGPVKRSCFRSFPNLSTLRKYTNSCISLSRKVMQWTHLKS